MKNIYGKINFNAFDKDKLETAVRKKFSIKIFSIITLLEIAHLLIFAYLIPHPNKFDIIRIHASISNITQKNTDKTILFITICYALTFALYLVYANKVHKLLSCIKDGNLFKKENLNDINILMYISGFMLLSSSILGILYAALIQTGTGFGFNFNYIALFFMLIDTVMVLGFALANGTQIKSENDLTI